MLCWAPLGSATLRWALLRNKAKLCFARLRSALLSLDLLCWALPYRFLTLYPVTNPDANMIKLNTQNIAISLIIRLL